MGKPAVATFASKEAARWVWLVWGWSLAFGVSSIQAIQQQRPELLSD